MRWLGNRSPEEVEGARTAFIEKQLRALSRDWTLPEVTRSYTTNLPGEHEYARDLAILAAHGYAPIRQSGGKRLMVTFRRVDGQQEAAPHTGGAGEIDGRE